MSKDYQRFPKILKLFILLFTNLGTAFKIPEGTRGGNVQSVTIPAQIRGVHHNAPPPNTIPQHSRVFIQMPGDAVYSGILKYSPSGNTPTPESLSINQVLMRGRNRNILMTGVHFSGNHQDNYLREYRCFIKTTQGTIYKADLERYRSEYLPNVPNRVFVRLPIQGYPVYTGVLHINDGFQPMWLNSQN